MSTHAFNLECKIAIRISSIPNKVSFNFSGINCLNLYLSSEFIWVISLVLFFRDSLKSSVTFLDPHLIFSPESPAVCVSTWDFICYIENFCVANLLKMAMVLGLSYIVLLFFYLLYKLGICWCIGHSLCKILWACLVSWFSIWEYCCTFFWVKLIKLKRRNQVHRRNIEHEFDTSEADAYYDYDVESHSFDDSPRDRSLSSRSREIDYRGTHLRKSLRPRSHNVRLGISRDSMHRHGHSHRRNTIKQHTHNGTIHGIKVAHSSKFVKKDRSNKRGAAYRSRRW